MFNSLSAQNCAVNAGLLNETICEGELVNNCADGVKSSEAEHDLNRRSEFIVISK
ncbi:hypothetical protein [Pseudofulvibacter geojedonensis]|uniref:OmpA-like domain-containing protein n=1 Tax=Pseudofulvibacter geojedonensis TaxID=1123758 RepID=A0ABW3I0J0_9FLAO